MNRTDTSPEQQTPTLQQTLLDLTVQHHTVGRLPEAEGIYRQILQANPNQPVVLHLHGVVAHQKGENDRAVDLITKARSIKPDYAEAHNNLGAALKELERLDEATDSYNNALAIKPDYAEAHRNLGNAFKELGRLDEAIGSYHNAIKIGPNYPQALNNLGHALRDLGKWDKVKVELTAGKKQRI